KAIVSRHLQPSLAALVQYYSLRPLLPDCAVLISALARLGHADVADAVAAFDLGMHALSSDAKDFTLLQLDRCGIQQIDDVLRRLALASPGIKKRVLSACAYAVAADHIIEAEEAELVRAIAETLDCPIPPFVQGVR